MVHRGDDRAVTVQIGAVLLLAIVFAALALYQLNAVPAENERVEFTHNQQVHDELQDLRNAIQNVGTGGGTQSTAVTLGTRYPSRTVAANPPAPTGRLETTGSANVTVDARFAGNESDYDGNPHDLTGDHETTTLAYAPDYREYGTAPTTRIEHGFAFNDFDDAQVSLTDQPIVSDGTIRLVVLEGELSQSGSGAVSLDPTALSGPSDPVPIEGADGDNVTITVPTAAPAAWNDTIGTTFDDGESGARVTEYASSGDGNGTLTIELTEGTYDLQVARVGVGSGGETSTRYDVERRNSDGGDGDDGGSSAYDVGWNPSEIDAANDRVSCTADRCSFEAAGEGDTATLVAQTTPAVDGATVEYAVNDSEVGRIDPRSGTIEGGEHRTELEAWNNGTVIAYGSSGGSGDRVSIDITVESAVDSDPSIDDVTVTDAGTGNDRYDVTADVSDPDGDLDRVEFELRDTNDQTIDTDADDTIGSASGTGDGQLTASGNDIDSEYTISVTVYDERSGSVTETRTVEST